MSSRLDEIVEVTRVRLATEMKQRSLNDLEREAAAVDPPRDFEGALRAPGISLIAEIKRASPSAGSIRREADPPGLAEAYERGGARAVSVLTEPEFFGGSLEDMQTARAAVNLPVLRKDFLLDPYGVIQARAAEADAVLLIVAALSDPGLFRDMWEAVKQCGLSALVEVHDEHELEAAFEVDPQIIGVNQRNLRTFEVDTSLALRLRREIPQNAVMVAESGIRSRREVEELENAKVDAVLVGETLMRASDPAEAVRELLGNSGEQDG